MDALHIIEQLDKNQGLFKSLFASISGDLVHWRPSPEKWNLVEIVCHLCDEEREDFRARLESILENPNNPFTPIDPQNWVKERNYDKQDFKLKAKEFLSERKQSIDWLRAIKNPKWTNTYKHPKLGDMSAWYVLNNWLAHDYLHTRQIIRYKYQYIENNYHPDLNYAGNW
ncbi:DinB family protein [Hyphobacterium sp. CCMP332]|nr:DinB family protein [Hyphobacterium sp. CCMP332]